MSARCKEQPAYFGGQKFPIQTSSGDKMDSISSASGCAERRSRQLVS